MNRDSQRFTIDGSDQLEERLASLCDQVLAGVKQALRPERLDALVLAGGYGRGQGGVLRTPSGDRPYNDLEFYAFSRGHGLFDAARFNGKLNRLGEQLSVDAGLHVEFKLDCLRRFRRRPISMFSYDLVAAHRILAGENSVFQGCEHHLEAERLPVSEATRLLFNRCTGLLLVKKLLRQRSLSANDADFIGRNLAKAQLALGDALLAASGQYHWSCLERSRRMMDGSLSLGSPQDLEPIRAHHAAGIEFKLHPRQINKPAAEFAAEHGAISRLAARLWLNLESRRLASRFDGPGEYAVSRLDKCPESPAWRNYLLNCRSLGAGALFDGASLRYPRNRLFNSLPLLLWNGELANEPDLLRLVQRQLRTRAADWSELVTAYEEIWSRYG